MYRRHRARHLTEGLGAAAALTPTFATTTAPASTPEHPRGFIDGEEWFRFSGGANEDRDCIRCAPSMHRTIQPDNVLGDGLRSAVHEVDRARVHDLPDDESAR
ncbi:hypothetical protein [Streptomyces cahuitamycinicus]|uniref:Uncharacterized protein n=1 Tax=Streptomyces cahuitamycinicus TaxID=2070367 RepID=A0A2N8TLT1_9ACTN|nr:hypothetical protein [Streptomyces cahuitamycinicus]PNG19981.1 hypothetical protein C1J00_22665 [Streptomyces cahuitamycinicus]